MPSMRLLIVSIFSIILITRQRGYWQGSFAFDMELDIICWSIVGVFTIWPILVSFLKAGKILPLSQVSKIVLGISISSIVIVAAMSSNRHQYFDQKSLLKIGTSADFNGVTIDFKKDGTYIFNRYGLGADYGYGSYAISQNHIYLQPENPTGTHISDSLIIVIGVNGTQTVVEVDGMGKEEANSTRFQVIEDNR